MCSVCDIEIENDPMNNQYQPAFPTNGLHPGSSDGDELCGLTKRELFAAMAMQGMSANSEIFGPIFQQHPSAVAHWAVKAADALLAALEAEPVPPQDAVG